MSRNISNAIVFGQALGRIDLPQAVIDCAAVLAKSYYRDAEADDFNEQVGTFSLPKWLTDGAEAWKPSVEALGLQYTKNKGEIVATAGVDQHTDHAHGYVLMIVLHNDGLKFRQGRSSHQHQAGDWYIFDDRQNHGVKEVKGEGTYVGWAIPLAAKD